MALTLVNRPEVFWGATTLATWMRTSLNFVVPFLVAIHARWQLLREVVSHPGS